MKIQRTHLTLLLVLFSMITTTYFLIYVNPLKIPITDDLGYIPWGAHQVPMKDLFDFTLVSGHQQLITKITVWFLGFLPGNYVTYIAYYNYSLFLVAVFLLIRANFNSNKDVFFLVLVSSVLCLNLKQIYMFFMVTAMGPIQAFFGIALYFFLYPSKSIHTRFIKYFTLMVTPATTGLGLVLPLSVAFFLTIEVLRDKRISIKQITDFLLSLSSISLFYLLPGYFGMVEGTAKRAESTLDSLIECLVNPHLTILLIFSLIGNVFIAASRFDPIATTFIGLVFVTTIFYEKFYRSFRRIPMVTVPTSTLIPGIFFIANICLYRGGGTMEGWINATSPRYILGSLFLVVGLVSFLGASNKLKKLTTVLLLSLSFSSVLGGYKTGLEWFSTRKTQQISLISCLESHEVIELDLYSPCFNKAFIFTDTSDKSDFLKRFNSFLIYRSDNV